MKRSDVVLLVGQKTRQSPLAIIILIFAFLKSLINGLWPILLFLFVQGKQAIGTYWPVLLIGSAVFSLVSSILYYFRFHFTLSEEKILVEKGILRRTTIDIPFDRIQNISFEEGVIHQIFDIVKIKVDTAGSSRQEFSFHALERDKAIALREFIIKRKSVVNQPEAEAVPNRQILHLGFLDLVKVGLSQNHLRTIGLALAALYGLIENFEGILGDQLYDRLENVASNILASSVIVLLTGFIFLLVVLLLATMVLTILRFYNLQLFETRTGYQLESGLLNRKEQAAGRTKVQYMQWISNPIKRLFRINTIRLFLAGSSEVRANQTLTIPGARKKHLDIVREQLFEKNAVTSGISEYWNNVSKHLLFRRMIFLLVVPGLIMLGIAFWKQLIWLGVLSGVFVLISWWYQLRFYKNRTYMVDQAHIVTHYGVIEQWYKMLEIRKVQGVTLKQSPYQRRYDLASVVFHTASGNIGIPYLPLSVALTMKNFVIYKSEIQKGAWM